MSIFGKASRFTLAKPEWSLRAAGDSLVKGFVAATLVSGAIGAYQGSKYVVNNGKGVNPLSEYTAPRETALGQIVWVGNIFDSITSRGTGTIVGALVTSTVLDAVRGSSVRPAASSSIIGKIDYTAG